VAVKCLWRHMLWALVGPSLLASPQIPWQGRESPPSYTCRLPSTTRRVCGTAPSQDIQYRSWQANPRVLILGTHRALTAMPQITPSNRDTLMPNCASSEGMSFYSASVMPAWIPTCSHRIFTRTCSELCTVGYQLCVIVLFCNLPLRVPRTAQLYE